jgi:hypothetical protein
MIINKDFREFIELLNEHEVKYLVIDGYAVSMHGYPRYTKDVDFWIWMDTGNISNLIEAIKDFGFDSLDLDEEDFLDPDNIIQLGYEPNRIDLLVQVEGVDFIDCYKNKLQLEIEGLIIDFISIGDLITAKKASGRLQDLADVEHLKKILDKKGKS